MKILFIAPSFPPYYYGYKTPVSYMNKILTKFSSTSLEFATLAALTPDKHTVRIVDESCQTLEDDYDCDLIGITCMTPNSIRAYQIADFFRCKGKTVVIGGWHPTVMPYEAKNHADSVLLGEAEETWPVLLADFEKNNLKSFYRQQRSVNPKLIPQPKRELLDSRLIAPIQATRGCPYKCEFCAISNIPFGNIYRMRPVDNVIDEIKKIKQKIISFYDPSMTINFEYTKSLFSKMKPLNKKFDAFGNINMLGKDDSLLKLSKEAGCAQWVVGFDSVSQESLNSVGKKANIVKDYISIVKKIKDYGLGIHGNFIVGFDTDNKDIFEKTLNFVNKLDLDSAGFAVLIPYPGTPIYYKYEKEGRLLTKDWSQYYEGNVVFKPKNMSIEELCNGRDFIARKYNKLTKSSKRIIKSLRGGFSSFIYAFMQFPETLSNLTFEKEKN